MTIGRAMTVAALATAVAGCAAMGGRPDGAPAPRRAMAMLTMADGTTVGRAVASSTGGGVRIAIRALGLPPGQHGIHVHGVGRCDGPDFSSAGGHWNPMMKHHGTGSPAGPHAGDLPNLTVGADGRGALTMMLPAGTLTGLLDADGAALVIHAGADDLMSDPAGNSGARIACGVFMTR